MQGISCHNSPFVDSFIFPKHKSQLAPCKNRPLIYNPFSGGSVISSLFLSKIFVLKVKESIASLVFLAYV